jgi:hypothetical protein
MAWTALTPSPYISGYVVTHDDMNDLINNNLIALHEEGDFANNSIHLASIYGLSASNKDFIQYNSGTGFWAPHTLALSDLPAGGGATGDLLLWNGSAWAKRTLSQTIATGAQALDTEIQNSGGSPLFVSATVRLNVAGVGSSTVDACVRDASPANTIVASAALVNCTSITWIPLTFIVPVGFYWQLVSGYAGLGVQPVLESATWWWL